MVVKFHVLIFIHQFTFFKLHFVWSFFTMDRWLLFDDFFFLLLNLFFFKLVMQNFGFRHKLALCFWLNIYEPLIDEKTECMSEIWLFPYLNFPGILTGCSIYVNVLCAIAVSLQLYDLKHQDFIESQEEKYILFIPLNHWVQIEFYLKFFPF